jgi:hypothetical protein
MGNQVVDVYPSLTVGARENTYTRSHVRAFTLRTFTLSHFHTLALSHFHTFTRKMFT